MCRPVSLKTGEEREEVAVFEMTGKTGSYFYMAPEVVNEQPYNEKASSDMPPSPLLLYDGAMQGAPKDPSVSFIYCMCFQSLSIWERLIIAFPTCRIAVCVGRCVLFWRHHVRDLCRGNHFPDSGGANG